MDGLYHPGEGYQKASGGRVSGQKISHHLPTAGQIVPTPEPHERVVFLPHFVRGLGFPLHPFGRGIMYYYGIDLHDLSPNSFLNISTFIVVCEAFLRISPHFGLWLKVFNVKPKVVSGEHAECGGAMVGKMPNITWLEGSFVETVKGCNRGGFTSPSHATLSGSQPPSSGLDPQHGSCPGKRRACRGAAKER